MYMWCWSCFRTSDTHCVGVCEISNTLATTRNTLHNTPDTEAWEMNAVIDNPRLQSVVAVGAVWNQQFAGYIHIYSSSCVYVSEKVSRARWLKTNRWTPVSLVSFVRRVRVQIN